MKVTFAVRSALLVALALPAFLLGAPPEPRRIEIVAKKYSFEPSRIELKAGEPVEITFRSEDTKHGFASKELGLEKVVFTKDQPAKVSFTPDKPGTYAFKCARFCGMGHGRMKGQFIVTP